MRNLEAIAAQIERESVIFGERLQTAEAREAFTAFAERRAPNFSSAARPHEKRRTCLKQNWMIGSSLPSTPIAATKNTQP